MMWVRQPGVIEYLRLKQMVSTQDLVDILGETAVSYGQRGVESVNVEGSLEKLSSQLKRQRPLPLKNMLEKFMMLLFRIYH